MSAKTLMVLGSMSAVGKSVLVTGLCRVYARRSLRVSPFKAQNLSNNAAVCSGGEIGRAQAVQALAAGREPTVDMNPVLIKPMAGNRGQTIVHGQVWEGALDPVTRREQLWEAITQSYARVRRDADLVIIEGAGSPAELNLAAHDIANMSVARHAGAPCLLVGDIDRGGVFAQLLGTLALLEPGDRKRVRALVVNRFRGIPELFADGVRLLEEKGGVPVLGVVPYLADLGIAEEDAATLVGGPPTQAGGLDVAVVLLPHIANFDDLDPLALEPALRLRYVRGARELGRPAAIIVPGSKNTLNDMVWLDRVGLSDAIRSHARSGGAVAGLCGGYQMLGAEITDPGGSESVAGRAEGLGLLPVRTVLESAKTISRSRLTIGSDRGFWSALRGTVLEGYEIHLGRTEGGLPLCRVTHREGRAADGVDGACDESGRVFGTYLHGLFENDTLRSAWIREIGGSPAGFVFSRRRVEAYDRLADALEACLDMARLDRIIQEGAG